jgi:hypothetical protein
MRIVSIVQHSASATPAIQQPAPVVDVATSPADLDAMGQSFRAEPTRAGWVGPVLGRYDLALQFPGGPTERETGTARVYHARAGSEEWALVPFFNTNGTGFMHQPAIMRRVEGHWQVVADDPAPGEYHLYDIPPALLDHWDMADGTPPADAVVPDGIPEPAGQAR